MVQLCVKSRDSIFVRLYTSSNQKWFPGDFRYPVERSLVRRDTNPSDVCVSFPEFSTVPVVVGTLFK